MAKSIATKLQYEVSQLETYVTNVPESLKKMLAELDYFNSEKRVSSNYIEIFYCNRLIGFVQWIGYSNLYGHFNPCLKCHLILDEKDYSTKIFSDMVMSAIKTKEIENVKAKYLSWIFLPSIGLSPHIEIAVQDLSKKYKELFHEK